MTKPVLLVDTNFLIHIYGQATEDKPRGQNYSVLMGEGILNELSNKYDIRVTSTVLDEATVLPEFKGIRNWFDANEGGKAKIYKTPAFGGKNGGELSIMDVIQRTAGRDPTLPPAGDVDNLKIATLDKLLKKSALKDHVVSTQQVAEAALADGTMSRRNYDLLEAKTGDILRARGGFKPAEQVYAERGITPRPVAETKQPPKPATAPVVEPTVEVRMPPPPPPPVVPEIVLGEAAALGSSKFTAPQTEPHAPAGAKPGAGNAGAAGVGLVLGVEGLHDAVRRGDTVEGVIAGTNVATSGLQATEGVLTAAGKTLPLLTKAGKFIPGANLLVTAADGINQISKEDTTQHKVERGTVVAATATTGLVLGTAAATTAEAGAITAGVTTVLGTGAAGAGAAAVVVAAAPVVLTVAAVGAVAYTGEKALEAKRAWDDVDKMIADGGKAEKRGHYKSDDGKPSVLAYRHIAVAMLHHSENMKNENMNGAAGLPRDAKGRFKIEDFKKIDMRDPKNIAELERVLKSEIDRESKVIKDNDSILPRWMRGSDSADKMTMAQMEKADLTGAMQELQMYKRELADYDAAHPGDPATTQPGKPKMAKGPGGP